MRKLAQAGEQGLTVPEAKTETKEGKVEKARDKWLPYLGELEQATFKTKDRVFKDTDGTLKTMKETVVVTEGEERFSVVGNDLIGWRKGRGGTKRRLVRTFKNKFQDTPQGRERAAQQKAFRAMLRSKGVPGA